MIKTLLSFIWYEELDHLKNLGNGLRFTHRSGKLRLFGEKQHTARLHLHSLYNRSFYSKGSWEGDYRLGGR